MIRLGEGIKLIPLKFSPTTASQPELESQAVTDDIQAKVRWCKNANTWLCLETIQWPELAS